MTVFCKVTQCPYRSKQGFCRNKLVSITENGTCGHIYDKHGNIKPNWQEKVKEENMQEYYLQEEKDEGNS